MKTLDEKTKQHIQAVLRRHQVKRAAVFGSFARGEATEESDLDLLVEFPQGKSLLDLVAVKLDLEEALGQPVDVVTERALHPRLRDQILAEQVPLL